MAIKHGQILTVADTFVVDRIQTAGPGNLNIPQERIQELGDFNTVATVRDIPDLSYDLESLDTTTDFEAILCGLDPATVRHSRTDTVGTTSGSAVVTDASVVAGDLHRRIPDGTAGIPNGSYVGTVIASTSFRISSSATTQVDVNATATGSVSVTFGGDQFDFANAVPLDVISPFKASQQPPIFTTVGGIAIPYLNLENVTYRYGVTANATQSFTLRGDSVYYSVGTPYQENFAYSGGGVYTLAHTALTYTESGSTFHVVEVDYIAPDGTFGRLYHGADYTDTTTTFTLTTTIPTGSKVRATYFAAAAATYPQNVNTPAGNVKPAAVRGKDIDIYIGQVGGSLSRWTSVQSFEATRRVNLQNDQEFGNPHYVAQDYDTADVTGNVVVRPRNPQDLVDKVAEIANVSSSEVVGPLSSVPLQMEARVRHPDTGVVLKTIYVPDARFTPPAFSGRVNQRHDVTFSYQSDEGLIYVYSGTR